MDWSSGAGPGPPFTPHDFSPFDTDWNQEFVAGWLDGFRAARVAVVNLARLELVRYGLSVAETGTVRRLEEPAAPEPLDVPAPDNPEGHRAYEEGWGAGYEEGHQSMVRRLREQLEECQLFLTDGGTVTTMEIVSELVDHCRRLAETPDRLEITDKDIHAFIDGRSDHGRADADEADETPPSPPRRTWRQRLSGVWAMVRREVDRRTAVVALGSVLMTTSVGWVAFRNPSGPAVQEAARSQAPPGQYVAPNLWDDWDPAIRAQQLAWDYHVWLMEQAGMQPQLNELVTNIMLMQGQDTLKADIATYVWMTGRDEMAPALLFGLHPDVSGITARMTIANALWKLWEDGHMDPVPAGVGAALQAYQGLNVETHPQVLLSLGDLVTAFQNQ